MNFKHEKVLRVIRIPPVLLLLLPVRSSFVENSQKSSIDNEKSAMISYTMSVLRGISVWGDCRDRLCKNGRAVCPQTADANRKMQSQSNPDSLESSMNFIIRVTLLFCAKSVNVRGKWRGEGERE